MKKKIEDNPGASTWTQAFQAFVDNLAPHELSSDALQKLETLLKKADCDPAFAIEWAATKGHLPLVQTLLLNEHIDPAANNNQALIQACEYTHVNIVKTLLADKRVNPADKDNLALFVACQSQNAKAAVEVVTLLLKDERVSFANENPEDDHFLDEAVQAGNCKLVKLLLADKRDIDEQYIFSALFSACRKGYADILKVFFAYPEKIDRFLGDEELLVAAAESADRESLQYLLSFDLFKKQAENLVRDNQKSFIECIGQHQCFAPFINTEIQRAQMEGKLEVLNTLLKTRYFYSTRTAHAAPGLYKNGLLKMKISSSNSSEEDMILGSDEDPSSFWIP